MKKQISENDFLTTIVRDDLSEGYRLVQSCHAVADFAANHGEEFVKWQSKSNYLCCLEASPLKIQTTISRLEELEIKYNVFLEPDIGNEITAIAIEAIPREQHKKLFKRFKLSLS